MPTEAIQVTQTKAHEVRLAPETAKNILVATSRQRFVLDAICPHSLKSVTSRNVVQVTIGMSAFHPADLCFRSTV